MGTTVFNTAQQHILQVMSFIKTPEELQELEDLLTQYYANKIDNQLDEMWKDGKIDVATIEEWGKEHMRTPYRD